MMNSMSNTRMATLESAGFKFPEIFGASRHPFLDDGGRPRNPRSVGFELCTIGAGCEALCFESGRFRIILISDDGCGVPNFEEWNAALISVDVDAYSPAGYDLICMTGQEWQSMLN